MKEREKEGEEEIERERENERETEKERDRARERSFLTKGSDTKLPLRGISFPLLVKSFAHRQGQRGGQRHTGQ